MEQLVFRCSIGASTTLECSLHNFFFLGSRGMLAGYTMRDADMFTCVQFHDLICIQGISVVSSIFYFIGLWSVSRLHLIKVHADSIPIDNACVRTRGGVGAVNMG